MGVSPVLDGGIFVLFLGLGLGALFASFAYGSWLKLLGAFLLLALGLIMNAQYDVAFTNTASDGVNPPVKEVRYIIGDGDDTTDNHQTWVGWTFIALGCLCAFAFLIDCIRNGF